ncbi:type I glyceraldehyde-3-phosphate dehydrogenase [Texcoconibacillus texcoconensis]|uniref:Glyceraldehyde-3-phosphate dehydrogenase n=1 Tax=Texcoconibacillus texcoconensis TaxID=1095777 RepID=A0A840QN01_9BACI|nr:type I glyceraldehyde-3-phosphate dehydrogenase [Texcoconibacillus texcoconensis]MBB5172711.1 glyceraldehyde 3-phosphate dehydrogenase [Texcoconibacillus texcoconensis]
MNVAINGFGRIGRLVLRKAMIERDISVTAINASYPTDTLAHLFQYDTVHGTYQGNVDWTEDALIIDGQKINVCSERQPEKLPWQDLGVELVIEATGAFRKREEAARHLEAGAKKVLITAPGKKVDETFVYGVNHDDFDPTKHHVVSNASCTTNCLAPVMQVVDEQLGVDAGIMTTVHSYTNDQNTNDNPHKDLRRARGCQQSIIPTSTGAAEALSKVLPSLEGKMNGIALRVPTPNVSLVDVVVDVKKSVTAEEVNRLFQQASKSSKQSVISYSDSPLVSVDYNGHPSSAIIDGLSTQVIGDHKIQLIAWYDNEYGYACRVVDMASHMIESMGSSALNEISENDRSIV